MKKNLSKRREISDELSTDFKHSSENSETTPFHNKKVENSKVPQLLGMIIRHPLKSLGQAFLRLDRRDQQKIMYGLQCTAGLALLSGGGALLMSGGSSLIAGGLIGTGSLNSLRSIAQYAMRDHAKSLEGGSRAEKYNSMLATGSNMPQAFSGSVAGMSAVVAYTIRIIKYALEEQNQKSLRHARLALEFQEHPVTNTTAQPLGLIRRSVKKVDDGVHYVLSETGRSIQKYGGKKGEAFLNRGPAYTMMGRGVIQIGEGAFLWMNSGGLVGAPLVVAGSIYVMAATAMKISDHASLTIDKSFEDKQKKLPLEPLV